MGCNRSILRPRTRKMDTIIEISEHGQARVDVSRKIRGSRMEEQTAFCEATEAAKSIRDWLPISKDPKKLASKNEFKPVNADYEATRRSY